MRSAASSYISIITRTQEITSFSFVGVVVSRFQLHFIVRSNLCWDWGRVDSGPSAAAVAGGLGHGADVRWGIACFNTCNASEGRPQAQ